MMQLLGLLAVTGLVAGFIGGAYWDGTDGSIMGASTGFTSSVMIWFLASTVRRAVHEYRINRYFNQDDS